MRFLPTARIVVLDANAEHRSTICKSLAELGLIQLLQAATLKEARQMAQERPVDLCVVHAHGFEARTKEDGNKIFPNPFIHDRTPTILLSSDTSRAATHEAAASGYLAVVALPVMPRVLYRRIGSTLQRARRSGRLMGGVLQQSRMGVSGFATSGSDGTSHKSAQAADD